MLLCLLVCLGDALRGPSLRAVRTVQSLAAWGRSMPTNAKAADRGTVVDKDGVPVNGIIDYIGNTTVPSGERWEPVPTAPEMLFAPPTRAQTRANVWAMFRQLPWKKLPKGRFVLRAKIGGELPLEATSGSFISNLNSPKDTDAVGSLEELERLFLYAAVDQRVVGVFVELSALGCGYAKLTEVRRAMERFRKSGKPLYAYFASGAEKEFFLASGCKEVYIPPDGSLDLRGFVGGAQFFRGALDKLGVEPQVQRIGKYKSAGDQFNRTSIAEAQREVVSSLLMETSDYWAETVARSLGKSRQEVLSLWSADAGIKTPLDFLNEGYITGVNYLDAVEAKVLKDVECFGNISTGEFFLGAAMTSTLSFQNFLAEKFGNIEVNHGDEVLSSWPSLSSSSLSSSNLTTRVARKRRLIEEHFGAGAVNYTNFDLDQHFTEQPRRSLSAVVPIVAPPKRWGAGALASKLRGDNSSSSSSPPKPSRVHFYPAGLYLRKTRRLRLQGVPIVAARERVAIINAVGGIAGGQSSQRSGGQSIGSDTLIEQIRRCKNDPAIKALVLRVDSPGGSALASDLIWKELRSLSRTKPVVASMVDVAASGGYYLSMACDAIYAEHATITGSIGVVSAKFNLGELYKKIGLSTEIVSRGRFAEVLASTRGFTPAEDEYFADGAAKAYLSFITKAAASRGFASVDDMNTVAQGRVWTGRQAKDRGLVDRTGGLWAAVSEACRLAGLNTTTRGFPIQTIRANQRGLGLPFLSGASSLSSSSPSWSSGVGDQLLVVDDVVAGLGLASNEALGLQGWMGALGAGPATALALAQRARGLLDQFRAAEVVAGAGAGAGAGKWDVKALLLAVEDAIDGLLWGGSE